MSEPRLSALLRSTPVPDEDEAAARAWRLVEREHSRRAPSNSLLQGFGRRRGWAVAIALAAAVVAAALSPPGRAVLGSLRDAVSPTRTERPRAELRALPTRGDVLVTGAAGAWIVHADGARRRLGSFRDATWSPHGLYVAAASGRDLVALDPLGTIRWTLPAPQAVRLPSWSPAGAPGDTRIAFLAGSVLHVVGGDARGDRAVARAVAPARPAWQPHARFVLAFASARAVHVYAVEPLRPLWQTRLPATPTQLVWSSDGERLLAVTPRALRMYDASGRVVGSAGGAAAAAFAPGTHEAFAVRRRRGASTVVSQSGRTVFATPGEIAGIAFSPDGRWLLLDWRSADEWLFLRRGTRRVVPVANIARAFGSNASPALAGWCCGS